MAQAGTKTLSLSLDIARGDLKHHSTQACGRVPDRAWENPGRSRAEVNPVLARCRPTRGAVDRTWLELGFSWPGFEQMWGQVGASWLDLGQV